MHAALPEPPSRIRGLEREGDDFPYYVGKPVWLSGSQWVFVVAAVGLAFLALFYSQRLFPSGLAGFVPAILFVAIPLIALRICAGTGWRAIFRRLRPIDFFWMVAFFILNYAVTLVVGTLAVKYFAAVGNPAGNILQTVSTGEQILFFLRSAIQLFGEELLVILPFLALLYWFTAKLGIGRTPAVMLSTLIIAIGFALVHLPTYQWNWGQTLVGLVPVRIVLMLPYLLTKNIWVSTGTHILNDWTTFGLPLLLAGAATPEG